VCVYTDANHMHLLVTFYERALFLSRAHPECLAASPPPAAPPPLSPAPQLILCVCHTTTHYPATTHLHLTTHCRGSHFASSSYMQTALHVSCSFLSPLFTIKISRKLHILLCLCCAAAKETRWEYANEKCTYTLRKNASTLIEIPENLVLL